MQTSDGQFLYGFHSSGGLVRIPVGGGAEQHLDAGYGLLASSLQVDDHYVYFSTGGTYSGVQVGRTPKTGGSPEWLVAGLPAPLSFIAAGTEVFFLDADGSVKVALNTVPASLQPFIGDTSSIRAMGIRGETIYLAGAHDGTDGLFAARLSDPHLVPVAVWPALPPRGLSHFALDWNYAYVVEGVLGAVSRINLWTGETVTLFIPSTPQDARGDHGAIAFDGTTIWMIAGGQLWRVATDGSGGGAVHSTAENDLVLVGDSVYFSAMEGGVPSTFRVCR